SGVPDLLARSGVHHRGGDGRLPGLRGVLRGLVRCPPVSTVKIPPVLRSSTGGEKEVPAEGSNVGEVLRAVASAHPDTERQLFQEDGSLNRYVNVYLNDEDVRVLDGLDTPVRDSDTLVI